MTFVAAALLICVALAFRSAATWSAALYLHPKFVLTGFDQRLAWIIAWYSMLLVLTPLVFYLARRVRFRRGHWLAPLGFHLPASVVVTVAAGVMLDVLFGGLVLGHGWPEGLRDFATPFWTQMALVYALGDTSWYWLILACGTLFASYDDYQAKRVQAADLERSLAAAQVDALKMKLQPHFLFNTLNSISFMALEHDTAAVTMMVERLGNLLRASMQSDGHQLISLAEELALVDQYLAIEEVRFKDRLRVVRRVNPAVAGALVPSLVLQPIIENSIKHGFSRRLDASLLEIAITRESDQLVTRIRDDGPGLPAGWDPSTSLGRGLRNVTERLNVLYGDRWSLALRNGDPTGTVAELRIPWSGASIEAFP
jgi:two-component system LytT family sensor kinase